MPLPESANPSNALVSHERRPVSEPLTDFERAMTCVYMNECERNIAFGWYHLIVGLSGIPVATPKT